MAVSPLRSAKSSPLFAPWPDARWRASARRRLLKWYTVHQRDLPWRKSRDPYCIWISEIMLQQTQVATVIAYYHRFLDALPTIQHLAAASEQDVLRLWEGLGYYRRARQLHRAAQVIVSHYAGIFPNRLSDVLKLPGIGRYTAGAISSIAFDRPAPILEANTARLYSRLLGLRGDLAVPANQSLLWRFAEEIVPRRGAGAVNQALMELGSQVCTPAAPRCGQCPLSLHCTTAQRGLQDQIPSPKRRPAIEQVREASVVVWHRGRVLLRQCTPRERWAGMWDFPRFPFTPTNGDLNQALTNGVAAQTGIESRPIGHLTTIKHGVTRFRITLECYEAKCAQARSALNTSESLQWLLPTDLHSVPLSVSARKIASLIANRKS